MVKMSSNKSQEQKTPSGRRLQYTSSQYEELFESVINSTGSPVLRKSPRISSMASPTQANSPQHTAEEPQECASLENSQNIRSQNSPKAIPKNSEICSEASKKLSDYSESNQPDSISTLQSEEFRNNAVFSTPVDKKMKIVPKGLKESSATKTAKKKHKSFRNAINTLNTSQNLLNETLSQASSSFSLLQDIIPLSQAPKYFSHREKMLWLRERRGTGLYVACDSCNKWRFMEIADPLDLPKMWYCNMNPDPKFNRCTVPEQSISVLIDDDLIFNEYTAGSLVWARYLNYPWWPAIVEDDPDTEQYYWLEYMSDIPSFYHVMFFDAPNQPATRAWVNPKRMKPFLKNLNMKNTKNAIKFSDRILQAKKIAQNASNFAIKERLCKYGFLTYSNVEIHTPVTTPDISDDENDDPTTRKHINKSLTPKKNISKRRNTIVCTKNADLNIKIKKSFEGKSLTPKKKSPARRNTICVNSKHSDNENAKTVEIKKSFEYKETHHSSTEKRSNTQEKIEKVFKPRKSPGIKKRRYTIAKDSFEEKERCFINTESRELPEKQVKIEKVSKPRKPMIKTSDIRPETISEISLADEEKSDANNEYHEWFQTRTKQKIETVTKRRKSMAKSPKTSKKRRNTLSDHSFEDEVHSISEQLLTPENIKKRRNTTVVSSFGNEGQGIANKKYTEKLVTEKKSKKRRNTVAEQNLEDDEEINQTNLFTNLNRSSTKNRKQSTSMLSVGKEKQSCSNVFTRRNTISGNYLNDIGNIDNVFDLSEENVSSDTGHLKGQKTDLNSNRLNNNLHEVGGTTVDTNKKTSKKLKRRNSSEENYKLFKTHITSENDILTKKISNFEDKMKLVYKEIFDEDSNSAFQMTDNKKKLLDVIESNQNKPKKETPKKAKKSLTNKGFVRPLIVDHSSNSLNSENTINSFSPSATFNFGKQVETTDSYVDNSSSSFHFISASQSETKVKKRLGYSRLK